MSYLLNAVYLALIVLASPWLLYSALRKGKYREGFAEKFLGRVPRRQGDRPCIWLHAVSVGEVNLLAPLIAEIQRRWPQVECAISTTTMTGFALARKKYAQELVFYCPLDFSWAVGTAMRRIRPDMLVLAELELWPNIIRAAKQHGAQVAIVNGRLSEKSFRGYRRVSALLRPILKQIALIAAQNEQYAERFAHLLNESPTKKGSGVFFCGDGVEAAYDRRQKKTPDPLGRVARGGRFHVTGSLKFDGAQTDRNHPKTRLLAAQAGISSNDVVFLAGSTQPGEETLAIETFRKLLPRHPQLRLILVPRHPDRFAAVADLLDQSKMPWQRRSQLPSEGHFFQGERDACSDDLKNHSTNPRILLVDTIGELGYWWGTAHIGFVGGSMGGRGGQSMIEPAGYGVAVCFGKDTRNFRDVVALMLSDDAATVVRDGLQLTAFVRRCLENPRFAAEMGERARNLVQSQLGATGRTVDLLETIAGQRFNRSIKGRAA